MNKAHLVTIKRNCTKRQAKMYEEMMSAHKILVKIRKPSTVERKAAIRTAEEIKSATVAGQRRYHVNSATGPGAFRTKEGIRATVSRKAGVSAAGIKPFIRSKITKAPDTPVSVGIIIDMSASMQDLAEIAHSLRWIIGEAVSLAGGEVAAAGWTGGGTYPLQAPGEKDRVVIAPRCLRGHHAFTDSWWLLDEALGLTDSGRDGARVLLVFSDLIIDYHEREATEAIYREARMAGVGVVTVSPDGPYSVNEIPSSSGGSAVMMDVSGSVGAGAGSADVEAAKLAGLLGRKIREAAELAG